MLLGKIVSLKMSEKVPNSAEVVWSFASVEVLLRMSVTSYCAYQSYVFLLASCVCQGWYGGLLEYTCLALSTGSRAVALCYQQIDSSSC